MKIQLIINNTIMEPTFASKEELVSYLNKDAKFLQHLEKKYTNMPSKIYKNIDDFFNEINY